MSCQPPFLPRSRLLLPWLLAGMLLGGCEARPPAQPARTGEAAGQVKETGSRAPSAGQMADTATRTAAARPAASATRAVATGQASGDAKPDAGTLVLPSDPPMPDSPGPSSPGADDTAPSGARTAGKAAAARGINDATALRVLAANHCMSCHQQERKVVGPALQDIRQRYAGQPDAGTQLAASILKGGSRRWGPVPMPPQPHVNDRDLEVIIGWILQQH